MRPLQMNAARMLASLRESGSLDRLGAGGAALGIVLVALGWALEEGTVGVGGAVRTLGGVVFFAGLGLVVFGDPRRRMAAIGMFRRIVAGYLHRTAHWGWPDRVGLAAVAIGGALSAPAVVLQIIFRNGAVVAGPAVVLFWVGVFLLIYGRFYRRGDRRSPISHREERGKRRL